MLVKAVRVFPEPVGEEISTFFLSWMTGIAMDWGSVRDVKRSLNHMDTSGSINPSTSSVEYTLLTFSMLHQPNMESYTLTNGHILGLCAQPRAQTGTRKK
jgi:hypothetical protein